MEKYLKELLKHEGICNELVSLAGERSLEVLKHLAKLQDDEKIAKKLNVKVSDVRSVLNKLNQEGIVYYNRTKDPETGWFYYKWVLEPTKLRDWFARKVESRKRFFYNLVLEGDHYLCSDCGITSPYSFEVAMDYEFVCPVHQKQLDLIDEDVIEKHIQKIPSPPPLPEPVAMKKSKSKAKAAKPKKGSSKKSRSPKAKAAKPKKTVKSSKTTKKKAAKKPAKKTASRQKAPKNAKSKTARRKTTSKASRKSMEAAKAKTSKSKKK